MLRKLRQQCLDRLCLLPSTNPLDFGDKKELKISSGYHSLQAFSSVFIPPGSASDRPLDLLIIKWPGNAGRAENSGAHPAMAWPEKKTEVWTVNPFGYGASGKSASLGNLPEMATAVLRYAVANRKGVPILLLGNSIGCATALYQAVVHQDLSAKEGWDTDIVGLLLINPPPLPELITGFYHRWYYGPVTKWLANAIPEPADSVGQARRVNYPCFFLQCSGDEVVPPKYQNLIFEAYAGQKMKWIFSDSDHNSLPDLEPGSKYLSDLQCFFSEGFH